MSSTRSEWPLLVFTTIAPLCAGVWVVAALLSLLDICPQACVLTTGTYGILITALFIFSLFCSTLHLGKPMKALRAFMRLGNSTVSNEVFMGTLFATFSVIYLLIPASLTATGGIWKILLALVAAFAVLFILFQSLAYRMRTVPTWNSFAFSIESVAIALLGGICIVGALGYLALQLAFEVRLALVVLEAVCCISLVFIACAQGAIVAKTFSARREGETNLGRWIVLNMYRALALIIGLVLWGWGMLESEPQTVIMIAGVAMVVVGVFIGRYMFYRFYVNAGLPRG